MPKIFDLEERTAIFGENILKFMKRIPKNIIVNPIISQLVRSATSVGANYCEADDAHTKKDFTHKISLCKKESRESKHWLRMMGNIIDKSQKQEARKLWKEAQELNLIFSSIIISAKKQKSKQ